MWAPTVQDGNVTYERQLETTGSESPTTSNNDVYPENQ